MIETVNLIPLLFFGGFLNKTWTTILMPSTIKTHPLGGEKEEEGEKEVRMQKLEWAVPTCPRKQGAVGQVKSSKAQIK